MIFFCNMLFSASIWAH